MQVSSIRPDIKNGPISGKLPDNRISGVRNQSDIGHPDSFNILYTAEYPAEPDIRLKPIENNSLMVSKIEKLILNSSQIKFSKIYKFLFSNY